MTDTINKVRNYQGTNSFVVKMKSVVNQYGSLTPKQAEAVEKCLSSAPKTIDVTTLPDDLKKIVEYNGENSFVKDIASKFMCYGTLTERQKSAALSSIEKEENKSKKVNVRVPLIGDTIKVGRMIGIKLKEQYGLKFNPILLDVTKILGVTPKAVKVEAKMTVKRGDVCSICAKTLTDEFSMLSGVGKTCSKHFGVPYLTDRSQVTQYREEYLKKVDEVGKFEFWIPNTQIKYWDGHGEIVKNSIQENI